MDLVTRRNSEIFVISSQEVQVSTATQGHSIVEREENGLTDLMRLYDAVAKALVNNKIINKLSHKALGMTFSSAFDQDFRKQYLLN